jgi:hypothetical protein
MAIYFRARDRRECSPEEALDERGILRHGYGQRVPHTMRDGVSRLSDARAFWDQNRDSLLVVDARRIGGTEGNKPGYRVFDDDRGRQAIADARAAYIFDLENSWRTPPRDAAYGSYPLSAGEGSPCTVDGAAGTLVRQDGVLVCKPIAADAAKPPRDPEDEDDEDGDDEDEGEVTADARITSIDAMSAVHQRTMDALYRRIAEDVSRQWREGK